MKKALLVLLVCALVIGSVVHVKVVTASDDNENIVKKPIDVYLIIPTGKQTLYNDHISALMARYNTKIIDEKNISLLPSPKVGKCFITFGDKNILRGQLKKLGVKFNVEELPVSEDKIKEIREKSEEEVATLSPGTKIVWDDSNKRYSVLYGVGILPNGITDEIECESNLGKPDLQSIENWLDEFYMHLVSKNDVTTKLQSASVGGTWVLKTSLTKSFEQNPYGRVVYNVQIWKLMSETDNYNDYWAVGITNYQTTPGKYLYGSGYQTRMAWIENQGLLSDESLIDWDPTTIVPNTTISVSVGASPSLSWTWSIPNITVYDKSDPTNRTAYWWVDYYNSKNQAPCTGPYSNKPGSEFTVPQGKSFGVEISLNGLFSYVTWYDA